MLHFRIRQRPVSGLRVRALAAALLLSSVATAGAAAGPVGNEYAINDRPLPPKQWWTSCTDASGQRATLVHNCSGNKCDEEPGDLFLQRYDSDGDTVGGPVLVNENPAWLVGFRVVCSDDGWVAAQWAEAGCYKHRAFNPQNQPAGVTTSAASTDCRVRPNVAIGDDGMMMAAWPDWLPSQGSQILVQRFQAGGQPVGDAVRLSDGTAGSRVQPKVSIDETGAALVTWLGQADYSGHGPVVGRFVAADGQPEGEAFQVNTFGYGVNSDQAIVRHGAGIFEVAWNNPLEGGRLAREVHASGVVPASVVAPAAGITPALPHFGAPRILDSYRSSLGVAGHLEAGTETTWMFSDAYSRHWRSDDDSKTWSDPFAAGESPVDREVVGSNGAGVWMALRISDSSSEIHFARSTDDGANWSDLAASVTSPKPAYIPAARVRGAGSTWVAAWSVPDAGASSIVFARSSDGGVTWGSPAAVSTGADFGKLGFELVTDGSGTWIVMLADAGIRFLRSDDDGHNWSAPAAVVDGAYCPTCATSWRYTRVSLAHDDNDGWLAVFAAPLYQTASYGRDGDVYALRSSDGGANWSAPVPVAAHATGDGSPDFAPSIATDGSGRWLATWVSHHPVGAGDALDSDILVAGSTDLGATWSAPALLDGSMSDDEASDVHVSLAATGDGQWLAGWERTDFSSPPGLATDNLMIAAADATCGNGQAEIGESCDDGQRIDDDGCDSNCTASGCGNGIANAGEECDDGNHDEADGCSNVCEQARCGDGLVSPLETCDDGNTVDTDECPNHCGAPRCGDGVTQEGVEDCDAGSYPTASCTPDCKFARCGDGYVALRAEACDDGNTVDDDACPNDCSRATCGDGFTSLGWEECDPLDPLYASACTAGCLLVGLCGDVNADAVVTVGDAQAILRRAVGLDVDCPKAACDMDASGVVNVSDAHMDLRKAVGLVVGDKCSIGTGTIVFWIEETRSIASFQIDVDYSSTGGNFRGTGSSVACHSDLADGEPDDSDPGAVRFLAAFNDVDVTSVLTAGFVALDSFSGRLDLFRCEFEMPEERADARFAIRVTDATDPDGLALYPAPLVGYRVE